MKSNKFYFGFSLITMLALLTSCAMPMSGAHLMQAGKPVQKIDPKKVNKTAEIYTLSPRDVLAIQVQTLINTGAVYKLEKGNQIKIGFTEPMNAVSNYKLVPGDELSLEFPDEIEGNYQILVNPDGRISLPRIGKSILVTGLTLADLNGVTAKEYKGLLLKPKLVWAITRAYNEQLARLTADYYVGAEGNIAIAGLGQFKVLGKSEQEVAKMLTEAAKAKFKNDVEANVSVYEVNVRDQVDNRTTLSGVQMFSNTDSRPTRVSDEGTIFIPDLGDLMAQGKTIVELKNEITRKLQPKYQNPISVNVAIQEYAEHNIFIGGEVRQPGRYPFTNKLSLLKLITLAGWTNDNADMGNILLLRANKDDGYTIYTTNLDEVLEGKASSAQDFKISPQDLIIVPPTGIAKTNRFMTQYVKNFLPFSSNVSYNINRSSSQ